MVVLPISDGCIIPGQAAFRRKNDTHDELPVDEIPDLPVVLALPGVPSPLACGPLLDAADATDLPLDHPPGHRPAPQITGRIVATEGRPARHGGAAVDPRLGHLFASTTAGPAPRIIPTSRTA
jgi:hypothetical protein